ncbi:Senescence/dehydration-associated protein-related isoform 1 [Hibiscus syriacus]|uniref:Senescence/dehydration-associated protein-related isoform 1 n=1 Tax=Hibiscus syriacus TaxID=106335 RepID=A0A6A2YIY2_HIBSY|nr:Senescence/dehydration-associated protein-related isoform 1 [Hibiscus syriacus]
METTVIALILAVLLGAFLLIPRHGKSAHKNKVKSTVENSKVYDVTSYVEEHPGGDAILAHAGDDSTEGFFGPQHATRVFDMIDDFYIGDLQK